MMRRTRGLSVMVLALGVIALGVVDCHEEPTPPRSDYLPNVSPMNLVLNLQTAYGLRDAGAVADLLAPEYIFNLQPQDVLDLGTEFFTHDAESTRTAVLLECPDLSGICLLMEPRPPEAANDVELPADAVKIRADPRLVLTLQAGGKRCLQMTTQDLFFRPGRPELGEPSSRWYLLEWREIHSTATSPGETGAPAVLCPCAYDAFESAEWSGDWRDSLDCP